MAQDAPEILMPRIGQKTTGIGQHPDKPAHQSHIGQRIDLPYHTILLIEEPPGRSELYLSGNGPVIEIADHGRNEFIIGRIEIVKNGLRQFVLSIEPVEKPTERPPLGEIADRIPARIGTQPLRHPAVVIAQRPEVELLHPPLRPVPFGKMHQHGRFELPAPCH